MYKKKIKADSKLESKPSKVKMDKAYKGLLKKEKSLEKDTKKVVSQDKKRDSFADAVKKMGKGQQGESKLGEAAKAIAAGKGEKRPMGSIKMGKKPGEGGSGIRKKLMD